MPDRIYWDACVFLSYINGDADRLPDIEALLDDADKGLIQIVTSAVSTVEVAFGQAEQTGKALESATENRILGLWRPPSPIMTVEFYPQIAAVALRLMRDALPRGWSLQAMDAIHLATAQQWEAKAFHTYDDKLAKYAQLVGFDIGPPEARQKRLI